MTGSSEISRPKGKLDAGDLGTAAALGSLLLVTIGRVALSWRTFDRFMWDDGWFLQVARRVAAGDILYREVAWDYGPFPVYILSLLLRIEPSVIWLHFLDLLLVAAAVLAVYLAGRSVVSPRMALAITAWATLLGGPVGLISQHLNAYTSPVAWGTSTSLVAMAAACLWVQKRSLIALCVTAVFAVLALLSKPEFGLAGISVLAAALWLNHPPRRFALSALGCILAIFCFILLLLWLSVGSQFLHTLSIICHMAWMGVLPALCWAGWKARHAAMPACFWILCIFGITVSLRWFFIGTNSTVAAGPVALVLCLLVGRGVLRPPTPAGWLAVVFFLLFSSAESELRSIRPPTSLQPVTTALGIVRLPAPEARSIQFMQAALAAAPAGGLFVAGGGPGWYLISDRPNPTRFDVLWFGLGTTEPEAGQILADLRANPPAVVLVEREFRLPETISDKKIWAPQAGPMLPAQAPRTVAGRCAS
jgi:hypothetical protein